MKKSVITRPFCILVFLVLQFSFVLTGFVFAAAPVISSFSPTSGPVGSQVILSGSGFHADPTQNIVFFGKVRTKVIEASESRLIIEVPYGASADLITVTVNGLTADSEKPFLITFPVSTEFPDGTFIREWFQPLAKPGGVADLDNDGRLDLIILHFFHSVRVLRNITSGGKLAFDPPIDVNPGPPSYKSITEDLNGDGKIDVVVLSTATNTFGVLRNTSTIGTIAFAPQVDYSISAEAMPGNGLSIKDLNADGRPDILVTNHDSRKIFVFKNVSSMGNISFVRETEYVTNGNPRDVATADLDGDRKPDIVVGVLNGNVYDIEVFKNSSVNTTISFADKIVYTNFNEMQEIEVADLNNDRKTDIIIPQAYGGMIILKNASSTGNILLERIPGKIIGHAPSHVTIGDLNGDGKLDLWSHYEDRMFGDMVLFRNTGTSGDFSFEKAPTNMPIIYSHNQSVLGDMNGDGKLDVIANMEFVQINLNTMGDWQQHGYCEQSKVSIQADRTGSNYQWQENRGTGFVNLSDNGTTITGSTSATLQLTNLPSSWNGYQYRCRVDGSWYGRVNVLKKNANSVVPTVNIASPLTTICAGTNISFTATVTNAGTNPTYQWQVNGVNISQQTSGTFSSSTLLNNDVVKVLLISKNVCGFNDTVSSNAISVSVNPVVHPAVSVSASTAAICEGETVTFTAVPQHGGNQPSYQWSKNGIAVGGNSNQYTDQNLKTGDSISVLLTSNAGCITTPTASSNKLAVSVAIRVTPAVTVEGNTTVTMGQMTTLHANVINGGNTPLFQWQDSTYAHNWQNIIGASTASLDYSPFTTGDKVRCVLTSNAVCVTHPTVTSNAVSFIVNSPGIVNPNPVQGTLQIRGFSTTDNWQTLEIHSLSTGKKMIIQNIVGQSQIAVEVERLSKGMYVVVLRNNEGRTHQIKFVKL